MRDATARAWARAYGSLLGCQLPKIEDENEKYSKVLGVNRWRRMSVFKKLNDRQALADRMSICNEDRHGLVGADSCELRALLLTFTKVDC